ncbi:MAG: helix-turn-helix domain-containing protein [Ilyomonas sp.]
MENIIFKICRENSGLSFATTARQLGITVERLEAIENGKALLTMKEAQAAGVLFRTNPGFLYNSALETELLNTQRALIEMLMREHNELNQSLLEDNSK